MGWTRHRLGLAAGGLLLAAAAAAAWLAPRQSAPSAELQALQDRCVQDMLRQTCRVMTNPSAAAAAPTDAVLFVAGYGPVDPGLAQELRASGDAMCQTALAHCRAAWEGQRCRAVRALIGT